RLAVEGDAARLPLRRAAGGVDAAAGRQRRGIRPDVRVDQPSLARADAPADRDRAGAGLGRGREEGGAGRAAGHSGAPAGPGGTGAGTRVALYRRIAVSRGERLTVGGADRVGEPGVLD